MTVDLDHSPTPAFRAQLEWELVRAVRREARFGTASARPPQRLRAVAVIAACLAIGVGSNLAYAQVRDGARRDSLLDAARAQLAVMAMRMDLARGQLDLARRHASVGATAAADVATAEAELRSLATRTERQQLNVAEIQATALPPRDDLNAPPIAGRDFVRERITLELNEAQQRLSAAERVQNEVDRRVRVGVATELSRADAQMELSRAQGNLAILADRLALRREYLEKGTSAAELAKRLEVVQMREDARLAHQALDLARAGAGAIERQRAAGTATDLDAMRAQVEVKERELEVSQLMAQLRRIGGNANE